MNRVKTGLDTLREKAEEKLFGDRATRETLFREAPASLADALRLVHELQVHRIELEMQNSELIAARTELERALALYTELYDSAPVGFITLLGEGIIRQANLAAARLLGVERDSLPNLRFAAFVATEDRAALTTALADVRNGRPVASCKVTLLRASTRVELTVSAPTPDEYRVVAVGRP